MLAVELYPKEFRDYRIFHDFRDGRLVDLSTRPTQEDEQLAAIARRIGREQRVFGNQPYDGLLNLLRETDSSLVAEEVMINLVFFKDFPKKEVLNLHSLAFCNSKIVKKRLAYTLAWFWYPENILPFLSLLSESDEEISRVAVSCLCYSGIESLAALPFIQARLKVGFDFLFMAKTIRQICHLALLGSGQPFLPRSDTARVPSKVYLDAIHGGVVHLKRLDDLVIPR